MPRSKKRRPPIRQFQCKNEKCCAHGRTWLKRTIPSQCNKCGEDGQLIPKGEEIGVFVCKFKCECGRQYTVKCRMQDTAKCYKCRKHNSPHGFIPRWNIKKKTDNVHSCSRCNDGRDGHCPNLSGRGLH